VLCVWQGRIALEEAVYSFLMQDYTGEKELVILNDYEEQDLIFEHPEVRIYNVKERYPTLATKMNDLLDMCKYEYLAPWAPDDICMPWRLSVSVERMNKGGPLLHIPDNYKNFQYYGPGHWIIAKYENGEINLIPQDTFDHGATLYSRAAYNEGKPYNLEWSSCLGCQIDNKMQILGYWSFDSNMPNEKTFYLYRRFLTEEKWFPHVLAARAMGDRGGDITKSQEHYVKYAKKGKIQINPHWKMDYSSFFGFHNGMALNALVP